MTENSAWGAAWTDYRSRRRWFFGVSLGGFLVLIVLPEAWGACFGGGDAAVPFAGGLAVPWVAAWMVVASRLYLFRCPRCGQFFFFTWLVHSVFAPRCLHCGLPKWATQEHDGYEEGGESLQRDLGAERR